MLRRQEREMVEERMLQQFERHIEKHSVVSKLAFTARGESAVPGAKQGAAPW